LKHFAILLIFGGVFDMLISQCNKIELQSFSTNPSFGEKSSLTFFSKFINLNNYLSLFIILIVLGEEFFSYKGNYLCNMHVNVRIPIEAKFNIGNYNLKNSI
jgi:hypothetical protein